MVLGLLGSLAVRRRRVWLRILPSAPARADGGTSLTVVEVGGRARSDSGNFGAEFAALLSRLQSATASTDSRALIGAGKE
jgi:cytochrome c biogenesis protein